MNTTTALLVIDVQCGFIESEPHVYKGREILQTIKMLIYRAGRAHIPIVYVQHDSDPEIDGPIHPSIAPHDQDIVISKLTQDAFFETSLQNILQNKGIKNLVMVGFQTEMCIDTTCRRACELGYNVILAEDAHSTFDNLNNAASVIITQYIEAWQQFTSVKLSQEIRFN